jgi:hypothetical protein
MQRWSWLVLATLTACGTTPAGCAHFTPVGAYESQLKVAAVPLAVDVDLPEVVVQAKNAEGRSPPPIEAGPLQDLQLALQEALRRDFAEHGPFRIDRANPEAMLSVRAEFDITNGKFHVCLGALAVIAVPAVPCLLLGLPMTSAQVTVRLTAAVKAHNGTVLVEVHGNATETRHTGLYYGHGLTTEKVLREAVEQVRARLADNREVLLKRLQDSREQPASPPPASPTPVAAPPPAPAGCSGDADCKEGRVCVNGECADPPASPPAAGCAKDLDCKGSRICVKGQCVERGR